MDFAWSGDSKWIAYAKSLPNRLHAISIYSLETGKSTQVTDGMSDARYPAFDRDGQYLYFTASTNYGPTPERPRHDQRRARGDQQRLPGGAAQQHRLAAGAGER